MSVDGETRHLANELRERAQRLFGRSLQIRHLDVGSSNGCDWEVTALLNPVYDLQRFGIDFVASPRHADLLLVTGAVTRNLEPALWATYEATPSPKLVMAVGACACGGGVFGEGYATAGGVDRRLPVDIYVPGCPPRPQTILHGLLLALDRVEQKIRGRKSEKVRPVLPLDGDMDGGNILRPSATAVAGESGPGEP
jgi:Ni,Fe-hydrogenase III small subunit